jgi:hypothetical protein
MAGARPWTASAPCGGACGAAGTHPEQEGRVCRQQLAGERMQLARAPAAQRPPRRTPALLSSFTRRALPLPRGTAAGGQAPGLPARVRARRGRAALQQQLQQARQALARAPRSSGVARRGRPARGAGRRQAGRGVQAAQLDARRARRAGPVAAAGGGGRCAERGRHVSTQRLPDGGQWH